MIGCDNLSKKEENAQNYMTQIAQNTNRMMKLPAKVDEYTFAEKVKFDKETNTIIYTYIIDKNDYGTSNDFNNSFKQIENEQITRAKANQGNDINYQTLGVTIKSVYKNKENDILYSFDIRPKDYIQSKMPNSKNEIKEKTKNGFSEESFKLDFNNGLSYKFGDVFNKDKKLIFSTISSSQTTILNLTTEIGNPFGEIIEKSQIVVELVLKYKAGTITFKSKDYRDYLTETDKLSDYDVSSFFKNNTNTNLEELQRYANYLDLTRENWKRTDKDDKEDVQLLESENKYITEKRYKYSEKDLTRLKGLMEEFENYFDNSNNYNYFTNITENKFSPNLINTKSNFCLRLFNDFEQVEDTNNIDYIPTIDKFKVQNAEARIYLTATNTNGFEFNDLVKTINITDKWNNNFVKYSLLEN
ncbi:hypothetical protein ULMS_29160 [Patiriisocius marinistellae]|uniref:Uncharacterized protein n=3 Tax=Flavobacteriaceae TaxID=49546 RepID=A0A5J4G0V8_9FLAO|nr:hypothetical protein ULMS_29160 [Patiriisocius marinistellae]